ncbi:hypothetical protein BJV78DRAFT_336694 [Lactifluus subvellereus]|nr:hypothetical protein BJV78DRAFT_336694 [Lactifluus subvellereus]
MVFRSLILIFLSFSSHPLDSLRIISPSVFHTTSIGISRARVFANCFLTSRFTASTESEDSTSTMKGLPTAWKSGLMRRIQTFMMNGGQWRTRMVLYNNGVGDDLQLVANEDEGSHGDWRILNSPIGVAGFEMGGRSTLN